MSGQGDVRREKLLINYNLDWGFEGHGRIRIKGIKM